MSRRQTVVSKTGKVYKYRQVDPTTKRIRVNVGYGYEDGSMTKLAFKNGKLTEAGKMFRESINDIKDPNERRATLSEFDKYVAKRSQSNQTTTVASFTSHMEETAYDRLLNNLNIDKNEVINKLKEKYGDTITYGGSTFNTEDVVEDYILFNRFVDFNYEEGWTVR